MSGGVSGTCTSSPSRTSFTTVARDMMASQIHIGLGVWLLLLAGAGLIAAGFGLIRNPLAKG